MMSDQKKVLALWPSAKAESVIVSGQSMFRVTIKPNRAAYGKTIAATWREASKMILYSAELRAGEKASENGN